MIKSMTGYGKASGVILDKEITVEIKSLNHRYCEIYCKLPPDFSFYEHEIRKVLLAKLTRGKVDIAIKWEGAAGKHAPSFNEALAREYYAMLTSLKKCLGIEGEIKLADIVTYRDIFGQSEEIQEKTLLPELIPILERALGTLLEMKIAEGKNLYLDLVGRIALMRTLVGDIEKRLPVFLEEHGQRLIKRVQEIAAEVNIDEARLAQEVAIMAERSDIAEEITRLYSHISQLEALLKDETQEGIGRKIDFLLQEMGREINTIGAKSGDLAIVHAVIALKGELSKIREQGQNIE